MRTSDVQNVAKALEYLEAARLDVVKSRLRGTLTKARIADAHLHNALIKIDDAIDVLENGY